MTAQEIKATPSVPLRSAEEIDLASFNALKGPDDKQGKPVKDMRRLFYKQVILDDETIFNVETIKVPGFIGISNDLEVTDPHGKTVLGHEDVAKFLERDGLLICTYQYNKDQYGTPIDLRWPWTPDDSWLFMETFMKNEGHHAGAIVPAQRINGDNQQINSYATFNEPDAYHNGMFGHGDPALGTSPDGFIAVAQRLVFDEFVTQEQARGYTNSIICWMGLLNPFVEFTGNDFNGGDPTRVVDRATLKEFLKNGVLASLGSTDALDFLNAPENRLYCAEFMYINLNTPLYPFNKQGLTLLLDGDEGKAIEVLKLQERQNERRVNFLSRLASNPEFQSFNISMPVVLEDLPPLDALMAQNGQTVDPNSLPFPPFKLSQVMRRAFRTLLPRHKVNDQKLVEAQARLFASLEPMMLKQLGLENAPADDSKVVNLRQFVTLVAQQLEQQFDSYEEFDRVVDRIMQQADEMLVGAGDLAYFVPPRIYVDLGQNDGDNNLPQGWGFKLETVGALIARSAIKGTADGAIAPVTESCHEGESSNEGAIANGGETGNDDESCHEGAIANGGESSNKGSMNPLKALGLKK